MLGARRILLPPVVLSIVLLMAGGARASSSGGASLARELAGGFPGDAIRPLFLGTGAAWGTGIAVAAQVLLALLLAGVVAAWKREALARPRTRIATAVLLALWGAWAWISLVGLPDATIAARLVVTHGGNTGRTLDLLYRLFHPETARPALVNLMLDARGPAALPPIVAVARLGIWAGGTLVLGLAAAGAFLGAGWGAGILAAASCALSPALAVTLGSESPVAWMSVHVLAAWLALEVVLDPAAPVRLRQLAVIPALGFQFLATEPRLEYALLWVPIDAVLAWALVRRRSPAELLERIGDGARAGWAWVIARPGRTWASVAGIAALVAFPALSVRLPFLLWDQPRISSYYPFMVPTALWGFFVPGLVDLCRHALPGLAILAAAGLAWGLGKPVRSRGIGLGAAGLLAGHWYQSLSLTDWERVRLLGAVLPVLALLGLQAVGALSRPVRRLVVGAWAALVVVPIVAWGGLLPTPWVDGLSRNPIGDFDDAEQVRTVVAHLAERPDRCLVVPVLAPEHLESLEVRPDQRRMDLRVLRADAEVAVATGLDPESPALVDAMRNAAAACDQALVYLGLDCRIDGMDGCEALRRGLEPVEEIPVASAQYAGSVSYGRRGTPVPIGLYRLPPAGTRAAGEDVAQLAGDWDLRATVDLLADPSDEQAAALRLYRGFVEEPARLADALGCRPAAGVGVSRMDGGPDPVERLSGMPVRLRLSCAAGTGAAGCRLAGPSGMGGEDPLEGAGAPVEARVGPGPSLVLVASPVPLDLAAAAVASVDVDGAGAGAIERRVAGALGVLEQADGPCAGLVARAAGTLRGLVAAAAGRDPVWRVRTAADRRCVLRTVPGGSLAGTIGLPGHAGGGDGIAQQSIAGAGVDPGRSTDSPEAPCVLDLGTGAGAARRHLRLPVTGTRAGPAGPGTEAP